MIEQLYNGEVLLKFTEAGHRYKISLDGGNNWKSTQGVTTLINEAVPKNGLIQWAVDICLAENDRQAYIKKRDTAGDIGTQVHEAIENYIKDGVACVSTEDALAPFIAFLEWEDENKPKYLFTEKKVYSRNHNYCGTADVAFEVNGKRYLGDFKTSNPRREYRGKFKGSLSAYPAHFLQCAAYDVAYSEENVYQKPNFDAYMIIYITKDGKLHTFESRAVLKLKRLWLNLLLLARYLKSA